MTSARALAILAAVALGSLCQCSLFFGLDDLNGPGDSGAGDLEAGASGDTGVGPGAADTAGDDRGGNTGDAANFDAADGTIDAAEGGRLDAADGGRADGGRLDAAAGPDADGGQEAGTVDGGPEAGADASDAPSGTDGSDGGDLLAGLVAFYPFDETSGTTSIDASGNGHVATLLGGATFTAGVRGNAVTLSGSNQYVSLPGSVISGLTSFSISVWVNVPTASTWSRIFDFGTGTTTYMFLTVRSMAANTVRFAITTSGNTMEQQIDGPVLATGTWKHIVVLCAANTGTLYVDGVVANQNAAMTLNPSSLGAVTQTWLGRSEFGVDPFLNGQIDNLRIYSRALAATEVQALFAQHQ